MLEQLEAGAGDAPVAEAARRRTFAVISHPDAGKSTLTEALALHARAITQAGHVHGKAGRSATVSDWMEMEQARGISITSAVLQLTYRDTVLNLVDTPGHADFSEDTYRVLTAVDAAIMLVDAAKGLEVQTMKLFAVCKHRGIPIITVINKWDRVGQEPLELVDEIINEIGLQPTPLYWPVGEAGDFRGDAPIDWQVSVIQAIVHGASAAVHRGASGEGHAQPRLARLHEELEQAVVGDARGHGGVARIIDA